MEVLSFFSAPIYEIYYIRNFILFSLPPFSWEANSGLISFVS